MFQFEIEYVIYVECHQCPDYSPSHVISALKRVRHRLYECFKLIFSISVYRLNIHHERTQFRCMQDGNVDLRVVDNNNSHFRFLVTTASHPDGFAQTQVLSDFYNLTKMKS